MTTRCRHLCFLALLLALVLPAPAGGATVDEPVTKSPNVPTSAELVEQPKTWDGKEVDFTGEVVGEIMRRGDYAWIHINDDAYYLRNVEEGAALGGYNSGHAVWIPEKLTDDIEFVGDYTHEGDVVTITGTFNAACAEHGGDMDIHADSLAVKTAGHVVRERVHPFKALVAVALAVMAGALSWANRRLTHRERRGLFGLR